ncbi:uncharacterized protein LOC131246841 [Magnolia sinica]|uniref:uncharacterized protein LOC131246841 n=1 Tax=Magnolia sinica TaxID=86752 RepID=UPI00265AC119|nr:uncharacterized protein LOC131246841 [Magnolia sinica]
MSTAKSKTIKLFCPSLSKLVPFVAYEDHRLDLGTIARTFGLDPATLRLNGHFVSRGVNLISSVTWKSLLSFFDSRGFSTGTNGRDAVIVDGKLCRPDIANGGLHNPSNNGNGDDPKTTEDDGVGIKRKPQSEDVKFLKKRKMDRRSSGELASLCNPISSTTQFKCSCIGMNLKRPREDEIVLTTALCKRPR